MQQYEKGEGSLRLRFCKIGMPAYMLVGMFAGVIAGCGTKEPDIADDRAAVIKNEILPAYENYIQEEDIGYNEYSVYSLIYIDEDDVPELLYDNTADGRGTVVLSYQDGKVYGSRAVCRGFEFDYIPGGNKVIYRSYYDGEVSCHVSHLENGILSEEHSYLLQKDGNYQIDGMACQEEEYLDFEKKYFQCDDMINGWHGWENYDTMQEAYENMDGKLQEINK